MKMRNAVSLNAKPFGKSSAMTPGMRSRSSILPLYTSCSSFAQTALLVTSSKVCGTGRCSRRRNSQYRGTPSSRQRRMSSAAISMYAPLSGRLNVCSPFGKLCSVTRPGCVVPNV